jgi:DNA-binding CsgD family transcriptional regulator
VVQYERALAPGRDAPAPEAALLIEAAEAARWAGSLDRGLALLERAAVVATGAADRGLAWERLGWFRREAGDGEGALHAYERALVEIGSDRSSATAARVLATHAAALMLAGHNAAARERALEALQVTSRPEARPGTDGPGDAAAFGTARANALITLGVVEAMTGDPETGLALLQEGRDCAIAAGAHEEQLRSIVNTTFVLVNIGRGRECIELARQALDGLPGGRPLPPSAVTAVGNAVQAQTELGLWDDAEELLAVGLARAGNPFDLCGMQVAAADLRALRGRREEATALLDAAAVTLGTLHDPPTSAQLMRVRAALAVQQGDLPGARLCIDGAIGLLVGTDEHEPMLTTVAMALRIEGDAAPLAGLRDPRRVLELAQQADAAATEVAQTLAAARIARMIGRAELARCAEELAAVGDPLPGLDVPDTEAVWREVAEDCARAGRSYDEAYARLRQAESLVRQRRKDRAAACLQAAAEIADRLAAAPLADAVQVLARRARIMLTGAMPVRAADHGLTPRELDVLHLLATGSTNRQVARALAMSEKTASVHVSRIISKLGVHNRGQAAAAARTLGLLQD